ncbi:MAG: hypothetical protein JNL08_14225 [Planctomycetes bacterium]|nr:hypothetical protein [Planctomycetota bacterium]
MRPFAFPVLFPLLLAAVPAQHAILVTSSVSAGEQTLALDLPAVDFVDPDAIYEVVPLPGTPYSARPFLPVSLQWHYVGDLDNDGQYVEGSVDGPMGSSATIDEIFVKAGTVAPVGPRDVFFSISAANAVFGVLASDVVRYAGQGVREVFLTEAQLEVATGGTTLNLDALCQSPAGDLFLSFALGETLHFGSALDGDLLFVPASSITYDGSGNVLSIAANAAVRVATEANLVAMRTNSGFREFDGTTPTTTFNLSGLEIDPNGGTWISPVDALAYPNVLFTWKDSSNDGAILSTAAGGSFAVVNGVTLGSAVATTGAQLGWQPGLSGTNGPNGLALIPLQAPQFQVLNYPRNLHTQGDGQTFVQLQTSGGAPNGFTILAWSVEASVAGGTFPAIPAFAPFAGEFGITAPLVIGLFFNDALGNCASPLIVLDTALMSGAQVAAQAVDFPSFQLSTPSAMSFL